VGKTVVTAALVAMARSKGIDAVPFKPVQTGCTGRAEALKAPDLEFSLRMGNLDLGLEAREQMAPFRYRPACSPHLAAKRAGRSVKTSVIKRNFGALARTHDSVVVEGAGGVMVPISASRSMLDLMQTLALPIVLVSRPQLGTLNHTLLSLGTLKDAGLDVLAVVLVRTEPGKSNYIELDNRKTLQRLGKIPVLGPLPFLPEIRSGKITSKNFLCRLDPAITPLFSILNPEP
jgi:dethiobiotin synthetase